MDRYVLEQRGLPALDGLPDAARRDGGLDAATLAWVLADLRIDTEGLLLAEPIPAEDLARFRDDLVRALQGAWPE